MPLFEWWVSGMCMSGWGDGKDGCFAACLSLCIEPAFEFIQEDDVCIIIRKEIAPSVQGPLRPKLTPLGLYPADKPVLCFGDGEEERICERAAACVCVCMCINVFTYPATSSYVVGWCLRIPLRTRLCPLLMRVSFEGSPPIGLERCGWGREERKDLSAPAGREEKRGREKCRAATASSLRTADGKGEESSAERETKASSSAALRRRVAAWVPVPERTKRKGRTRRRIGPGVGESRKPSRSGTS